jgi:ABC-type polar amino acid transport system ATPase subunit
VSNIIEVVNLTRIYNSETVLHGVSFDVKEGETVALIGPSGAGKSTLLRCIAGLEPIQEGSVEFSKTLVASSEKQLNQLSGEIGMLFQQFNLFSHLTALENINLGLIKVKGLDKIDATEQAHALLNRVGLTDRANHYPFELSGGQQQRLAIARALAMKPKVMLFDEPTSALDPEYTREVLNVIRELSNSGMTVLIVTHEMNFAREISNRVIFMDKGTIIEQGQTEEVFTNPKKIRTTQFLQQILGI